jgi:dGTPase
MKENLPPQIISEILLNNLYREKNTFSKFACFSYRGYRFEEEAVPDRKNIRTPFFHDTDKIIHSKVYSRYIDKTQVFYLFENDHITHRVLHVQLVSKIARVIGRFLRLNEDLIEAISLGHDLGHVPYGHFGERELNEISGRFGFGYFCHNAQSVRALKELENKGRGLNLTLQVLDGILCHNGELISKNYKPNYNKTKADFLIEFDNCWTIKDYSKKIVPMTLEGCVVRISDVIAYLGRDFEDAQLLGLITAEEIPEECKSILGSTNSEIINTLVLDLVENSIHNDSLTFSESIYKSLLLFYDFSVQNVYDNPKRSTQNEKIKSMFEILFKIYLDDVVNMKGETLITKEYLKSMDLSYIKKNPPERIVIDFIAGMTDDFINNEFKHFVIPESFGYKIKSE